MIQVITGDCGTKGKFEKDTKYTVSDFKSPKVFDDFELNILDFSFYDLWKYQPNANNSLNMLKDLKHFKNIIGDAINTKIVIVLPQNINYKYYWYADKYRCSEYLKNMLDFIENLLVNNVYSYAFQLKFATTITKLNDVNIKADFYFNKECFDKEEIILESDNSKKLTTIKVKENLYYTTLNLMENKDSLEAFLFKTKIIEEGEKEPEWIKDINILDDEKIKEEVSKIESNILKLEQEKENEIKKLEKNNKIKSILYQTDKKLQMTVITMLNEMLKYEDNDFKDRMEEDYKICKEDVTFIIETKGLLRNIKGEDISKTDNHVAIYLDELDEKNVKENVKGIYIVATQRDKKIEEREKTPDRQISLAKRNEILIIRTEQFLKLFEAYKNKKITTEKIIELFKNETGEFEYNEE